jgi:hypothetical protein
MECSIDPQGEALIAAIQNRNKEVACRFLDDGVDIEYQVAGGATELIVATSYEGRGANVDHQNDVAYTALLVAAKYDHVV